MATESDFLDWLRSEHRSGGPVRVGPGDDLAVLDWNAGDLLIVGADQVLDGVHFDSAIHTPEQIGRKAMNRNLSDCAAMACLPVAAVATVALPREAGLEFAKGLYRGVRDAGLAFACPVVGGDTASWDGRLALSVTILGRSAGIAPVTRSGAQPGDAIYVTGPLGGSILGRHMSFVPRITLARSLAAAVPISAMIDLSDGLSRDLPRICAMSGGLGAVLVQDAVPLHADARELSARDGRLPREHALHDGEDHELLFTTSSSSVPQELDGARLARIGTIGAPSTAIELEDASGRRTPLRRAGWEHSL